MYYVYLIQHDVSREVYIGYTKDIRVRLAQHNSRSNVSTSRREGAWRLIYAEVYKSQADARSRERKLKHHGSAKHELLKRIKNSQLET